MTLLAGAVDWAHDNRQVDDLVAPPATVAVGADREDSTKLPPADFRDIVVQGASLEFTQRGYSATTLEHIAARANVSLGTLKTVFPNKPAIVVAALSPVVTHLCASLGDSKRFHLDEPEIIKRYLAQLATKALENIVFIEALVAIEVCEARVCPDITQVLEHELDLAAPIVLVVEKIVGNKESARDTARLLIHTLLLHCVEHRDQSAEATASTVSATLLHGIMPR
jgi:AcrR family transcriptional regulator